MDDLDLKIRELGTFKNNRNGVVGVSVEYISEIYELLLEYQELKNRLADDGK